MQTTKEIFQNRGSYKQLPAGRSSKIPTDRKLRSYELQATKKYDCDYLLEDLSDLINSEFRLWYLKVFYKLGKETVLRCASIARTEGKNKSRYFSFLIKKELK